MIRYPPAESSLLKPLQREPGLPRVRRLQLLQALDRRIQRRFVLGETQPHQALARGRAFVERRQRDRGDALLDRQPAAELEIVQVADRRIVDQLEIDRKRTRLNSSH